MQGLRRAGSLHGFLTRPIDTVRPAADRLRHDRDRRAFLIGFGFTKRDIVRIKALAETAAANFTPAALNDLDVPFRIGAIWPGMERHSSSRVLGEWAGRTLLFAWR